jgi:hypothetical protein
VQTVEYLEALLDALKGQNYHLSEYEAALFIPCLVEKVGRFRTPHNRSSFDLYACCFNTD